MEVTNVKVFPQEGSALLAFCSVELDKELVITGVKLMEGRKGKFVSMPQSQGKDKNYYDIVFPLSKELREEITDAVIDAYEAEMDKPKSRRSKK